MGGSGPPGMVDFSDLRQNLPVDRGEDDAVDHYVRENRW